mmetsp:Transcript_3891/g.6853  ORF Transcript_3891/g.6853 Transcript_3891/m.6853 type:complete len:89 (+) Transcript_3891:181-447(+)|eukprot:CAMPEP_0184518632 /NCGR_PEP_ID=MMETSP0198_2-20121128/6186_1 /TAXON_ID=1112570 /ORGANISM="Thraustochytrium sp., Strain LLF1b" /LENGTH=88 /DNA_ID=CAMNT_0026909073 /DNA_START=145 /DNA_END=411 /DNA_ORIENTATION=+
MEPAEHHAATCRSLKEEQADHVDALSRLCTSVHALQAVLHKVNGQVSQLGDQFASVERGMDAVSLPFQSSVFDYQVREEERLSSAKQV